MRQNSQLTSGLVIAIGLPVLFLAVVALAVWTNDVRKDRTHTITLATPTPIFAGNGQNCITGKQIVVVNPGAVFLVRRIRYWKDCATLDVNLADGRSGHLVLGIGGVVVKPPLP